MDRKYTKKQILESIKYWEHELERMDESLRVSLADKQSATQALLDHNDELTAFAERQPRPTKDELIDFVANIFKEEGIDTPWTRQFLIKMKMYTHGFDDALQYVWNARFKGQKLGMDQGTRHGRMSEEDQGEPSELNESISWKSTIYVLIDEIRDQVKNVHGIIDDLESILKSSSPDIEKARSAVKQLADEYQDIAKVFGA